MSERGRSSGGGFGDARAGYPLSTVPYLGILLYSVGIPTNLSKDTTNLYKDTPNLSTDTPNLFKDNP